MVSDLELNRIGRALAAAGRIAHHGQAAIAEHPLLRQIAAEAAGLLDVVTGVAVTNPEDRADAHLRELGRLLGELPPLDGETSR